MDKLGRAILLLSGCLAACTSTFTFAPTHPDTNVVDALPVATLYLTGFPTRIVAGQQGNVTLTAYDNLGHVDTGYSANIHFVSDDANAILPDDYAFTLADAGKHTFSGVSLRTASPNTTIRLVDSNGMSAASEAIAVTSAAASRLDVTGPEDDVATAGVALTLTVTARDPYGNVATGYGETVYFRSSDESSIPPFGYTYTPSDAGSHVYDDALLLYESGPQSVTASDGNGLTGTWSVQVASASAQSFTLTLPAASVAGAPVAASLAAYDAYENRATGYLGTVTFRSTDLAALLPGAYTFTSVDAGSHTFPAAQTVLRTAGAITLTATDFSTGTMPLSAQATITVNANALHSYIVQIPGTVQPTLRFNGQITAIDAYQNTVTTYAGTAVLHSSDMAGSPSSALGQNVVFHAANMGVVAVPGLFLPTSGSQTLSARDSVLGAVQGVATTQVQAQNFTQTFDFNAAAATSYAYDTNRISLTNNAATLIAIDTLAGDTNAAAFAAGTQTNVGWDANNYLRLAQGPSMAPAIFYSGLEINDPSPTWSDTVDTAARGVSNVGGLCCGLAGPQANANSAMTYAGSGTALLYSGASTGTAPNYAYTKVWDLAASDIMLDANAYLAYWIFPQAQTGTLGNGSVSGNNSLYTALNLVFTDATDTVGAALLDANAVAFTPQGQGAGGHLVLNQWNYVRVDLSSLAGKSLDHIAVGWQNDGQSGGYRGFIDQIFVSGVHAGSPPTNAASLSGDWTPQWNQLVAYWPFDGTGAPSDGGVIAAAVGPNLTVHNSNGAGMGFVQGQVNQAMHLDGVDDWLVIPTSISGSGPWSVSAWLKQETIQHYASAFALGSDPYNGLYWQPNNQQGTLTQSAGTFASIQRSACCSTNAWEHVLVTSDNANLILYIDGVAIASASGLPVPNLSGGYIGQSGWNDPPFAGKIDEVAVWGVTLDANEVRTVYERQRSAFAGSQVSQVFPSPFSALAILGLRWAPTLPFGKPLPSGAVSESQSDYPALLNNALDTNLVALWHFDEPALQAAVGGDFYDDSGYGDVATVAPVGAAILPAQPGIFGRSIKLPYADAGVIAAGVSASNPENFTLQVWFRYAYNSDGGNGGKLIGFGDSATGFSSNYDRHIYLDAANHVVFGVYNGAITTIASPQTYGDNRWHQAAASLSASGMKLYVDGALVATNSSVVNAQAYAGYWHLGGDKLGGWPAAPRWTFSDGFIDEAAVWSRPLADAEIFELYRRGANRVHYQLRFCTAADCSDAPPWVGPDATSVSAFSEINNVMGSTVLAGAPRINFAPAVAALTTAPYVQYQAFLQTDDRVGNCTYAGQAAPCSPEIGAVQVFRSNYDTSGPGIKNVASAATPYFNLAHFAADSGTASCPSAVRYSLSFDGVHHYYHTGSHWSTSDGSVGQTNLASDLTDSVMAAFAATFPLGATYFTAYLHSDGVSPCALGDVSFSGKQ